MKEKLKNYLIIGLLVTNLIVLGMYIYRKPVQVEIPKIVTVTDTITVEQIKEKTKLVYVEHYDTIVVYNTDTLTIEIPIEHKQYVDTFSTDTTNLSVRIDYSGYKSKIDTIMYDFNYQPKVQPIKKQKMKFGQSITLGVQCGYGIAVNQQPSFQPYIGIGITYGIGVTW
jgi:hypothetical protein